jgi:hypothetical protein
LTKIVNDMGVKQMTRVVSGIVGLILLIGGIYLMQSISRTDSLLSLLQVVAGLACVAGGCQLTLMGFIPSVIGKRF